MPIIEVNHITKEYRLGHIKSLKQSVLGAIDRLRGRLTPKQEGMRQALHTRVKSGLDLFRPNKLNKPNVNIFIMSLIPQV